MQKVENTDNTAIDVKCDVSGSFKPPHDWFCEKYGIDILEERLELIEHNGKDVIYFIEQYLKDHRGILNYR